MRNNCPLCTVATGDPKHQGSPKEGQQNKRPTVAALCSSECQENTSYQGRGVSTCFAPRPPSTAICRYFVGVRISGVPCWQKGTKSHEQKCPQTQTSHSRLKLAREKRPPRDSVSRQQLFLHELHATASKPSDGSSVSLEESTLGGDGIPGRNLALKTSILKSAYRLASLQNVCSSRNVPTGNNSYFRAHLIKCIFLYLLRVKVNTGRTSETATPVQHFSRTKCLSSPSVIPCDQRVSAL